LDELRVPRAQRVARQPPLTLVLLLDEGLLLRLAPLAQLLGPRNHLLLALLGRLLERLERRGLFGLLRREQLRQPAAAALQRRRVLLPQPVVPLVQPPCAERGVRPDLERRGRADLALLAAVVLVDAPSVLLLPPLEDEVVGRQPHHETAV